MSRDDVYHFLWDLDTICSFCSKKCVLDKIQNGGKSILTEMGVAYMGRCVMTQGIQGKKNFDCTTYGSRVIRQNVKCAAIKCYSATIRPTDKIISQLILVNMMNLSNKSCSYSPYGLRGKNT